MYRTNACTVREVGNRSFSFQFSVLCSLFSGDSASGVWLLWVACCSTTSHCHYDFTTKTLGVNGRSGFFLDFMATSSGNVTILERNLLELHENSILWNKVKVFHNDLKTFGRSADAQIRLDSDPMAFCFMSSIYFTDSELEYLHNFPTSSGLS